MTITIIKYVKRHLLNVFLQLNENFRIVHVKGELGRRLGIGGLGTTPHNFVYLI